MFHEQSTNDELASPSIFGRAVNWLGRVSLIVAILIAPWWFGGVEPISHIVFFALTGIALVFACLSIASGRLRSWRLPLAVVPLLAAILFGALQLIPLPRSVRQVLSPANVQLNDSLIGQPDKTLDTARRPISIYPVETRRDLALLILAASTFVLGATFFWRPSTHVWLLGIVTVNGAALAFFGMVQKLAWNGKLYWTFPLTQGGLPFGPFVNRNNAGGYLILCAAAAIGLMMWIVTRWAESTSWETPRRHEGGRSEDDFDRRAWKPALRGGAFLDPRLLTTLTLAAILFAGVLTTMSRGAILATVVAAISTVAAVWAVRGRSVSIGWVAAAMLLTIPLVSWAGLTGSVRARVSTLLDGSVLSNGRVALWRDSLPAVADYWRTGSGLGTYQYIFPKFQKHLADNWYEHAENQYLEALVDGGVIGLALIVLMIVLIALAAFRVLRYDSDSRSVALAVAVTFALAGQVVAAFFDFGLSIPANMCLFAVMCGALAGRAARLNKVREGEAPAELEPPCTAARQEPRSPRLFALAVAITLVFGCVWGGATAKKTQRVASALRSIRLADTSTCYSIAELNEHLQRLHEVANTSEDDAEIQRTLAELYMQLYRARTLQELKGKTSLAEDDPRLLQLTSPLIVHERAHTLARTGMTDELDKQRKLPAVQAYLIPALRHFEKAREACPTLADVHRGIAELTWVAADPAMDQIHVERARRMAPSDPDMLFVCGLLDMHAGRIEAAFASWKQSLTLSARHMENVLALTDRYLAVDGMIKQILPDSPELLLSLARKRFPNPGQQATQQALIARAAHLLDRTDARDGESHHLRAVAWSLQGNVEAAVEHYRKAIRHDPRNAQLRHEFAEFLLQAGRLDEAREQAAWSARLAPRQRRHQRLLTQIHNAGG